MKKHYLIFIILVIYLIFSISTIKSYASEVSVEGVYVDKTSFPTTAWGIKGRIRNLENHPIKGYVKIKLLDAQGDIVASYAAPVNEGDPLDPGQAGPFEYWAPPNDLRGVERYQIIFKDR